MITLLDVTKFTLGITTSIETERQFDVMTVHALEKKLHEKIK